MLDDLQCIILYSHNNLWGTFYREEKQRLWDAEKSGQSLWGGGKIELGVLGFTLQLAFEEEAIVLDGLFLAFFLIPCLIQIKPFAHCLLSETLTNTKKKEREHILFIFYSPGAQCFVCFSKVRWRVNKIAAIKLVCVNLRKDWNPLKGNISVFSEHEINDLTNMGFWYLLADFGNESEGKRGGRGPWQEQGVPPTVGFPPFSGWGFLVTPQRRLHSAAFYRNPHLSSNTVLYKIEQLSS